jgi:dihydrofolate reductase
LGVHHFVVTHDPPKEWVFENSPFTFVTEGVEHAIEMARQVARDKHVAISSANVMRQALKAGLLDELHLDVAPVLLGRGVRLFGEETADLERLRTVVAPGVTHMQFRVVR